MLNDKTGTALELIKNQKFIDSCNIPEYIRKAIEFIDHEQS